MTVHTKEHLSEAESVRDNDQQLSNSCECLGDRSIGDVHMCEGPVYAEQYIA